MRDEKGDLVNHSTSGELCKFLGVTPRQLRRMRTRGVIPEPDARTSNGWGLWSPDQVTHIMHSVIRS